MLKFHKSFVAYSSVAWNLRVHWLPLNMIFTCNVELMSVNRYKSTRANDILVKYSLLLCLQARCTMHQAIDTVTLLCACSCSMLMHADIYNFFITLWLSRPNGIVPVQRCIQSISKWFHTIRAPEWATENERKIVKEQMKKHTFVIRMWAAKCWWVLTENCRFFF